MAGNRAGGLKAARSNTRRHGGYFYHEIGKIGGSVSHPHTRMFAVDNELARRAGRIGGLKSRRGKGKKTLAREASLAALRARIGERANG